MPVFLVDSGLNDRVLVLMVAEIHNSREKHSKEGGNAHQKYVDNHGCLGLTLQKCMKPAPPAPKLKAVKHGSKIWGHIDKG